MEIPPLDVPRLSTRCPSSLPGLNNLKVPLRTFLDSPGYVELPTNCPLSLSVPLMLSDVLEARSINAPVRFPLDPNVITASPLMPE